MKERYYLRDAGVNGITKMDFNKQHESIWSGSGRDLVVGFRDHENELSNAIKGRDFFLTS